MLDDILATPNQPPLNEMLKSLTQGNSEEQFEKLRQFLKFDLVDRSLREIGAFTWDPAILCPIWEKYLDEGFPDEPDIGVMATLLKFEDLTPRLKKYLEEQGLEKVSDHIKVEPHVPPIAQNNQFAGTTYNGSMFVCDDLLGEVINTKPSTIPLQAILDKDFSLKLEQFNGALKDEEHPQGRIGVVKVGKVNVAFVNRPIMSEANGSRGILLPNYLYTVGADPLHPALINGVDFNIGGVINLFRRFMTTGKDLSPGLKAA